MFPFGQREILDIQENCLLDTVNLEIIASIYYFEFSDDDDNESYIIVIM